MKVKAAQGLARILKSEGVPWVACYPTNHVNNALGEEDVPILMMREERYAVAVADAFSRVTGGKQVGVCTIMGGLNAAGIQLAYDAVAQAFEDSSPVLVITAGVPQGSGGHTHYDIVHVSCDRAVCHRLQPLSAIALQAARHPRTRSKKTIVQCTVDTLDIHRSYKTDYALIGDAKLTLQALIQELSAQTGGGVRQNQALIDEIKAGKEAFLAKFRPLMESNEKPINPYRVYGDLMKVLDPKNSFVTGDSGNTRDQISTVYEAQIPRGFLGWGNVSTLGFSLAATLGAKLAYPERQCVNITGDAGVSYMMGNFEAVSRYGLGVTTIHINNGGFAGYGPGFWGPGHDPYTHEVSDPFQGLYGVYGQGAGLPRRGCDGALRDHSGIAARS